MMKFDRLFKQDFKIVENRKKVFIVPAVIVVIALIAGIIFHCVTGSALNLGMDFTGGYSVSIRLGNRLTDATYGEYSRQAVSIAEGLTDDEGRPYGIKIDSVQRQGDADTRELLLRYKAVGSEEVMETVKDKLHDALEESMFVIRPAITWGEGKTSFTAKYSDPPLRGSAADFKAKLSAAGYNVQTVTANEADNSITVDLDEAFTGTDEELRAALGVNDALGGRVADPNQTGATVSGEMIKTTILAISIATLCMLIYIVIRFELLSGLAAVLALLHDIIIMFCCMTIFHIEINSTFIAALITILGYSINNTIIIFDRVRENFRLYSGKRVNGKLVKPEYIADKSVQETIWRSINTTLTTLITVAMLAIIGVPDIRVFVLPIIFGLLAGTFSSIFLAPSIWAMLAKAFPGSIKVKAPKAKRTAAKADNK